MNHGGVWLLFRDQLACSSQHSQLTTLNVTLFDRPPSGFRACRLRLPGWLVIEAGMRAEMLAPLTKVVGTGVSSTKSIRSDLKATPLIVISASPFPALTFLRERRVIRGPFSTDRVKAPDLFPSEFVTRTSRSAATLKNLSGATTSSKVLDTNLVSTASPLIVISEPRWNRSPSIRT